MPHTTKAARALFARFARVCLQVQHAAFLAFYLDMSHGTALGKLVSGLVRSAERVRSAPAVQPLAGPGGADSEPARAVVLAALSPNGMAAPAAVSRGRQPSGQLSKPAVGSCGGQLLAATQRGSRLRLPSNR